MVANPKLYQGTNTGAPLLVLPYPNPTTDAEHAANTRAIQQTVNTTLPPNPATGQVVTATTNAVGQVVTEWATPSAGGGVTKVNNVQGTTLSTWVVVGSFYTQTFTGTSYPLPAGVTHGQWTTVVNWQVAAASGPILATDVFHVSGILSNGFPGPLNNSNGGSISVGTFLATTGYLNELSFPLSVQQLTTGETMTVQLYLWSTNNQVEIVVNLIHQFLYN